MNPKFSQQDTKMTDQSNWSWDNLANADARPSQTAPAQTGPQTGPSSSSTAAAAATITSKDSSRDFVQKLYKMLEECQGGNIVGWAPDGKTFLIVDQLEFAKSILPKYFKHQNFASFVRQLNKYDFHKVKTAAFEMYSDTASEFKHPDFQQGNVNALDKIKRKAPGASRRGPNAPELTDQVERLEVEVSSLRDAYSTLNNRLRASDADRANLQNYVNKLNQTVANQSDAINQIMKVLNTVNNNKYQVTGAPPSIVSGAANVRVDMQQQAQENRLPPPSSQQHTSLVSGGDLKMSPYDIVSSDQKVLGGRSWSVLLAEDDSQSAEICARLLGKYGCTVHLVSNGLEAWEKAQTTPFDVIILNQILGSLDGFSCCANLRRSHIGTPVILMLVDTAINVEEQCRECGVTYILQKPFKKSKLYEALTVVLPNQSTSSANAGPRQMMQ